MNRDSRQEPISSFILQAVGRSLRERHSIDFLSVVNDRPSRIERQLMHVLRPTTIEIPEYVADGKLDDCSICLSEIVSGDKIKIIPCSSTVNHKFHSKCIDSWVQQGKTTCPNCRSNFTDNI